MPHTLKIKRPGSDTPSEFTISFPDDLSACQQTWDGDSALDQTVYHLAIAGARAQLLDYIRRLMKERVKGRGKNKTTSRPLTDAEIQEHINAWKPEAHKRSKAAIRKVTKLAAELSPEEREALLRSLQS